MTNVGKSAKTLASKHLGPGSGMGSFAFGVLTQAALGVATGDSLGKSVGTGLLYEGFLNAAAPGLFWAQLGYEGVKGGVSAYMAAKPQMSRRRRAALDPTNMYFNYQDTEQAYTMRQAAVQAIQGSHLNARSALGGEARLMHRSGPTLYR